jgi:glycosyltransferase involved in cell wall biosynthesis
MTTQPTVTILVPMRNEEAFIAACLASLRAQDYPADLLDILVLDGDSTDRSCEIVAAVAADDPRVRLLPNPRRTQAAAMNLGVEAATGEIIVRADAHATYGPSYVPTIIEHLVSGRAENVGGLQRGTGTTLFSRAVAAALNTPLGAGGAAYRLATEPQYTDTVWLGAWYRKTLLELDGFDETLPANEDYEHSLRLRKAGGRVLLDPTLPSTYHPRTSPARLWRQYFRYGIGKARVLRLHPESLILRQIIPPAFTLALLVSLGLLPLSPWPLAVVGGGYLLAVVLASLHAARHAGWPLVPCFLLIYPTIHLAWGFGLLWGLLSR